ncbi:alpha/beta fold hydrolase [Ottowia thiooxydans]
MPHDHFCSIGSLALKNGDSLPDVTIAYACYGKLSADGSNAILVTHGYTASHRLLAHGAGVAEGSWAPLIGPGKPLDPDRYFIVCPNMLGSCYGSTGPSSLNPKTGKPYGVTFPRIGFSDIVASQRALLDKLGVTHLRAVVGPSMGGFQALQWAIDHPDWLDTVAAVVSAPYLPQTESMSMDWLMHWLGRDPAWNNGEFTPGALYDTMCRLRVATLRQYGMETILNAQGVDPTDVQGRMERMAAQWAHEFDPHALVVLLRAALDFDVQPFMGAIRAKVLHVVARSDKLFPPNATMNCEMARVLGSYRYVEMDTDLGHSSSGPAHALWSPALAALID